MTVPPLRMIITVSLLCAQGMLRAALLIGVAKAFGVALASTFVNRPAVSRKSREIPTTAITRFIVFEV